MNAATDCCEGTGSILTPKLQQQETGKMLGAVGLGDQR